MTQALDRGTLDRLVALGRDRGLLTADDLRAALPVERMDVDALVLVMLELEAAGVSVEPEAFGPRRTGRSRPRSPFPRRGPARRRSGPRRRGRARLSRPPHPPRRPPRRSRSRTTAPMPAGPSSWPAWRPFWSSAPCS